MAQEQQTWFSYISSDNHLLFAFRLCCGVGMHLVQRWRHSLWEVFEIKYISYRCTLKQRKTHWEVILKQSFPSYKRWTPHSPNIRSGDLLWNALLLTHTWGTAAPPWDTQLTRRWKQNISQRLDLSPSCINYFYVLFQLTLKKESPDTSCSFHSSLLCVTFIS